MHPRRSAWLWLAWVSACANTKPAEPESRAATAAPMSSTAASPSLRSLRVPAQSPPMRGRLLVASGARLWRIDLTSSSSAASAQVSAQPGLGAGLQIFPTAAISPSGVIAAIVSGGDHGEHTEQLALLDGDAPPRRVGPIAQQVRNPWFTRDGAELIFESSHRSFRDLFRLQLRRDAGAGALTRLTDNPQGNFEPSLSPDGQTLAFTSSRDGDSEVYSMALLGPTIPPVHAATLPAVQRITAFHRDDWAPSWSPTGELSFLSDREGSDRIFVVRGDGTGLRRASAEADPRAVEASPSWARHGALAYLRRVADRSELRHGAVGSESWLSLTPSTATVSSFAWSPDGEWLAVIESDRGTAITRVLAISRDGATRLDLVDTSKVQIDRDAVVRWYPDAR